MNESKSQEIKDDKDFKVDKDGNPSGENEITTFSLDRTQIPSQQLENTFSKNDIEDLNEIGVQTFLASDLESNLMKQVDEHLEQQERIRSRNLLSDLKEQKVKLEDEIEKLKDGNFKQSPIIKNKLNKLEKQLNKVLDKIKKEEYNINKGPSVSQEVINILEKRDNKLVAVEDEEEEEYVEDENYEDENLVDEESEEEEDDYMQKENSKKRIANLKKNLDDYSDEHYHLRLEKWKTINKNQTYQNIPMHHIDDTFRIDKVTYRKLLPHQRVAIRWLWTLHTQKAGGILGDEMGLGKTIEMITFLYGLFQSGQLKNPVIILCPATVIHQWLREFNKWAPEFRTFVYHGSLHNSSNQLNSILKKCVQSTSNSENRISVMITTYDTVRINASEVLKINWDYVVLDEGHKIRNPNSSITITCKQFNTYHRIILSGSPIQNNLTELWSLFDFVFPGKLGTLPMFESQFSAPIIRGGFKNATTTEVRASYKCASILKNIIDPYLLRRTKADVKINLPGKNEQVLFCQLSKLQKEKYQAFLKSKESHLVLTGKMNLLYGVDILRKICNHSDLADPEERIKVNNDSDDFTDKSSKLKVMKHLLPSWRQDGHRVLIFTQTRQMLNILESFIMSLNFEYLRMDGTTPIAKRVLLIDQFNSDPNIFIFLLTTKVGGLGVNLTAANRIILFDPDWNPMTDIQARERAYRIGQKRELTIYRLITSGTIEEKIYHRQVFKQLLTEKVLKDPKLSRSIFSTSDLKKLFQLEEKKVTETVELYEQKMAEEEINETKVTESNEDWLLKGLMGEDLHSKIQHDKIIYASEGSEANRNSIDVISEQEAERLAKLSTKRLLESRASLSNVSISVPTWTGKTPKKRFGNTSSTPTKKLGASSETIKQSLLSNTLNKTGSSDAAMAQLREFLISNQNQASSKQIVEYFKEKIPREQLNLFRRLLKELADFDESKKLWKLKSWAIE